MMNVRVSKDSETVFRELTLPTNDTILLDDEYCLRPRSGQQDYFVDLLAKEMRK